MSQQEEQLLRFRNASLPLKSFLLARGLTVVGNALFDIVSTVFVFEVTRQIFMVAILMIVRSAPGLLLSPFGGTLSDKLSNRRILWITELLSGSLFLLFLVSQAPVVIDTIAFLKMCLRHFSSPVKNRLMTNLVSTDQIIQANGLLQVVIAGASLLGTGLGALLLPHKILAFLLITGSYWISTLVIGRLPDQWERECDLDENGNQPILKPVEGFRMLWNVKPIRYTTLLLGSVLIVSSVVNIPYVPFTTIDLHLSAAYYAVLIMVENIGNILGGSLVGVFARRSGAWNLLGTVIMVDGACISPLFVTHHVWLYFTLAFMSGIADAQLFSIALSVVQKESHPAIRGTLLGAYDTIFELCVLLGLLMGGAIDRIDTMRLFYGVAGLIIMTLPLLFRRAAAAGAVNFPVHK